MSADITAARIVALSPKVPLARAAEYAAALTAACASSSLTTPRRVAHFMAQLAWESANFRALVENLNYRDPAHLDRMFKSVQGTEHAKRLIKAGPVAIGNTIYASKLGNGGIASGDGFRFRGRGFIMTTGRANYAAADRHARLGLVADPDLLGRAGPAALAAVSFWDDKHISAAADAESVASVTRAVNGKAMHGLEGRTKLLAAAERIWG